MRRCAGSPPELARAGRTHIDFISIREDRFANANKRELVHGAAATPQQKYCFGLEDFLFTLKMMTGPVWTCRKWGSTVVKKPWRG